mmetsp:Transcript_74846/g.243068  ORF Transcript_74846/g.243068 Transcript_74846/m.243068 type:complete len:551 (+) Transcript_74846:112-1764(+)
MAMEDDTGGSRKRGLFLDLSQEPFAKAARQTNAEYLAAFQAFDIDRSGFIDIAELSNALQAVQHSVEATSPGVSNRLFPRPFQVTTCCWLCARFGDGARLSGTQFCELLDYVRNLKDIFNEIDVDTSGSISCAELHRAFQLSGVNVAENVVAQVGRSYDADSSGTLEFDEFVQMRLEWDCYITAWDRATSGNTVIQPERLLQVLEEVKRSMEPVGQSLQRQADVPVFMSQGLFFTSMFKVHRPFQAQTCEWLIIRFGEGNLFLTFSQYSAMLVFMKEMKSAFCKLDANASGSLNLDELYNCFAGLGMQLPPQLVAQIGQSFDRDNSGEIEFDEFVQMAVEWHEMMQQQSRFTEQASGRISATDLQELFGCVRVLYRVRDGAVQTMRAFSPHACRWLVAMFGSPMPGEAFAQGLAWNEFLTVIQYLKGAYAKYLTCDISRHGAVTTQDLWVALAACGIHMTQEVVDNIRRCYDTDSSGTFEFDEFIQLLVECQLYDQVFDARVAQPSTLTPLNRLNPLLGPALAAAGSANGLVTLDKSAFFSMAFAVPRNL